MPTPKPPPLTPSEILAGVVCSVAEAAQVSRLSPAEIYARAKDGRLDSVTVGRRVLIKTASLRQLLGIADDWSSQ